MFIGFATLVALANLAFGVAFAIATVALVTVAPSAQVWAGAAICVAWIAIRVAGVVWSVQAFRRIE